MDIWQRVAQAEAVAHAGFGESQTFGPLVATFVAPGLPLNTAWHDGTRPPTGEALASFEAFCAAHAQSATLHLLSPAAPAALPTLTGRGYRLDSVLHLYTRELRALPSSPLSVEESSDPDTWAEVSAQGFGEGSAETMRVVARAPGARLFVARLEGEPAGSGALGIKGDVAALYGMSTRPEFRQRGVQLALLAGRLRAAAASGATLATVFTTPGTGSERNIVRAGFVLSGMRLTFTRV
ncbi:GNAT family N-acetyltransferase [Deinococcus koreensis]|uniref:N-acetyltransferase n=1 Tax=Deinococcus koreensis TaxID=2054903 RepID=A0A2K3UZX1_9DEIO|nr:GNAT family N-acetyltransferase [Deinococcus koreensis]PNY82062.1 N-acetyltransferase [Deinococcus koreensis]